MSDTSDSPKPQERKGPLPASPFEKKAPPVHVKLINLLIVGFLAYAVLSYFSDGFDLTPDDNKLPEVAEGKAGPPHSDDPRIDRLRQQESFNSLSQLFPVSRPMVITETLTPGQGRRAFCGQEVTYRLHEAGKEGAEKSLTLGREFGDRLSLAWGIEGMQVGETRKIKVPKDFGAMPLGKVTEKDFTIYEVELLKLTPELPKAGPMPLRRFTQKGDAGMNLRCGEQAIAHVNLWSAEGKLLFSSLDGPPVYFELGGGHGVPYGLELAAEEMGPGGVYTVVLPPELVKPLHPGKQAAPPKELEVRAFPQDIVLPQGQVVMVDLSFLKAPPVKDAFQPAKELPMPEVTPDADATGK